MYFYNISLLTKKNKLSYENEQTNYFDNLLNQNNNIQKKIKNFSCYITITIFILFGILILIQIDLDNVLPCISPPIIPYIAPFIAPYIVPSIAPSINSIIHSKIKSLNISNYRFKYL